MAGRERFDAYLRSCFDRRAFQPATAAGQPEFSAIMPGPPADWVVIYSREPHSLGYRMTACARLDGGEGCPMQ